MQKIIPHLWFDKEAREAAEFYTSLLPNSKVTHVSTIHNTPSGDCDIVSFDLAGQSFMAISAGPIFKFTPAISFHIKCKTVEEVDTLWKKLSPGGKVLMELGEYPFSKRYGWLEDKYGLSWQIIYSGDQSFNQTIVPVIMYVGNVAGKAEEAINFYVDTFKDAPSSSGESKIHFISRYGKNPGPDKEDNVNYSHFSLNGFEMGAMDSAQDHKFTFSEAISFIIPCYTQEEIDYFWEKLSADPKAEQCGWLKDKYGVSWQVWATEIGKMMGSGDQEKVERVTKAFLQMKKFDIATLKKAYKGE